MMTVDSQPGNNTAQRRKGTDADQRSTPLSAALPALLLYLAAGLWLLRPSLGVWPLLLVGLAWLLRLLLTGSLFPRSAFDGPLVLFLLAAAVGASISVDRAAAWGNTFWIYLGAVVLYYAVILTPEQVKLARLRLDPLRILLLLLPSLVAVYFLLTTDWQVWQDKLAWMGPALDVLIAIRQPAPVNPLHINMAGGMIAALLPLQAGALCWDRSSWPLRIAGLALLAISLLGLMVSSSRGAMLALLTVTGAWLLWKAAGVVYASLVYEEDRSRMRHWQIVIWGVLGAVAALVGLGILIATPLGVRLLQTVSDSRLVIWLDALNLVQDTPLTGLGFDAFQMAHVSYVLLIHVGYQPHSHNLLLEIWLRQGLLGLIVLAWIAVNVVRLRRSPSWWRPWALASLVVILIHGLFDIPLYDGRGIMLAFIPLALLTLGPRGELVRLPARANLSLAVTLALAGALLVFLPAGRAVLHTNLGALAQTRAELALYRWPDWPLQDELRRTGAMDLAPIVARYQAALAENPANAAANRRLGQIELSLGQYAAARQHLEAAYASNPSQRATRQLLAESYAITGDVLAAAELLATVDTSLRQMDARIWWYNHIGQPELADVIRQAVALAADSTR